MIEALPDTQLRLACLGNWSQAEGHWVPILAILCDGANFEFLVLDSGTTGLLFWSYNRPHCQ